MEKIDCFKKEIEYIKDKNKQDDLKLLINMLPDYFFLIPASSTGKYHPLYASSDHGLVKHVKVVARIGYELINNESTTPTVKDNEKDIILMALLLHDGLKSGLIQEKYTRFDHPILMSNLVIENRDKLSLNLEEVELLASLIASHMGPWTRDYNGNEVLPKPKTKLEKFVHMCDYLASRKFLNVEFDNIDLRD